MRSYVDGGGEVRGISQSTDQKLWLFWSRSGFFSLKNCLRAMSPTYVISSLFPNESTRSRTIGLVISSVSISYSQRIFVRCFGGFFMCVVYRFHEFFQKEYLRGRSWIPQGSLSSDCVRIHLLESRMTRESKDTLELTTWSSQRDLQESPLVVSSLSSHQDIRGIRLDGACHCSWIPSRDHVHRSYG